MLRVYVGIGARLQKIKVSDIPCALWNSYVAANALYGVR